MGGGGKRREGREGKFRVLAGACAAGCRWPGEVDPLPMSAVK